MYVKDLGSKGVIVRLQQGMPGRTKYDRKRTIEHNMNLGAKQDSSRINKQLYGKTMANVVTAHGHVKAFYDANTWPWDRHGGRFLSATQYFKFMEKLRALITAADQTADDFCKGYADKIEQRRIEMGPMFNVNDYPDVQEIRKKFYHKVKVEPIPTSGHIMVDIDNEELKKIHKEVDDLVADKVQSALSDSFKRLHGVVSHMADKLTDLDESEKRGDKPPRMFKSMIGNISQLVNVLPQLNVVGDRDLDRMVEDIRDKLTDYTVDDFKEYPTIRKNAISDAEKILNELSGLM